MADYFDENGTIPATAVAEPPSSAQTSYGAQRQAKPEPEQDYLGGEEPEQPGEPESSTPQGEAADEGQEPAGTQSRGRQVKPPEIYGYGGRRLDLPQTPQEQSQAATQNRRRQEAAMFAGLPNEMKAQLVYERLKLSNAEDMRLQRIENAVGHVEARPDLERWEKDNLITKLRTQSDPLQERKLKAQAMQEESQTQAIKTKNDSLQATAQLFKEKDAQGIPKTVITMNDLNGIPHQYTRDHNGDLKQVEDHSKDLLKVQHDLDQRHKDVEKQFHEQAAKAYESVEKQIEHEEKVRGEGNKGVEPGDPRYQKAKEYDRNAMHQERAKAYGYKSWDIEDLDHRVEARQKKEAAGVAAEAADRRRETAAQGGVNPPAAQGQQAPQAGALPPTSQYDPAQQPYKVREEGTVPHVIGKVSPQQATMHAAMMKIREAIADKVPEDKKAGHLEDVDYMMRQLAKYGSVANMPNDLQDRWEAQMRYYDKLFPKKEKKTGESFGETFERHRKAVADWLPDMSFPLG